MVAASDSVIKMSQFQQIEQIRALLERLYQRQKIIKETLDRLCRNQAIVDNAMIKSQLQRVGQHSIQTSQTLAKSFLVLKIGYESIIQIEQVLQNQKLDSVSASIEQRIEQQSVDRKKKIKKKKIFYNYYPVHIKSEAVEMVQNGVPIQTVAEQYNTCAKNIQRWARHGVQRKHSNRPKRDKQMEKYLYDWIMAEAKLNKQISSDMIKNKALKLSKDEKFKASRDWLKKYIKRYDIGSILPNLL